MPTLVPRVTTAMFRYSPLPSSHIHDLGPRLDKSSVVVGMVRKWVPISFTYDFARLLYDATAIVYDSSTTGYDYTTIMVPIHHDPIRLATTASRFHYDCTRLTTTHHDPTTTTHDVTTMTKNATRLKTACPRCTTNGQDSFCCFLYNRPEDALKISSYN